MRSASPIDRRWTVVPPLSRETSRTGEGEATNTGWPVTQVICRNVSTGRSNGNEIGGTAFVDKSTGQANNPTGNKGTTTPVFVVPPLGNQISGNGGNGVLIDILA